jgi:hypothetical protein
MAACRRHRQPASASPARPCRQLRGQPRQILAVAVKTQVTAAPASCPRPGGPGVGSRRSSGAGPGIASRPDAVAGINWDTVRAPAADAGRRQARAARHLAGVPGRRLMPAAQSAKSPGTPPGDDDLDAAAAHPGQGGGRQPALPAGQQPARGTLATGHGGATPRVGPERQGLPPARQHHGTDPGRGWTAPSPVPNPACGKPADRRKDRSFPHVTAGAVAARVLTHADEWA